MKILWLANIPSPYRVNFFNELGKLCELTVLFERKTSAERDLSWKTFEVSNFEAIFLPIRFKVGVDGAFCPSVRKYLIRNKYDKIIVTNYSSLTGLYAILKLKQRKIEYIIESDGAFPGNGRGIKEKIKKWIISGARLCFSTGKTHDNYYKFYGCSTENIVRYSFTSLYKNDIICEPVNHNIVIALKSELNIAEEKIVLSVGRFSYLNGYGKGFDVLIKIAKELPSIGFYIVGDNPTNEFIEYKKKNFINNIHFVSFVKKNILKKYYQVADCMVLLTRGDAWGLVINEAMANGLPIITTDKCIAGLELVNDENGKIVNINEFDTIKNEINKVIFDEKLNSKMRKNSLKKIQNYTFENMAREHIWSLHENNK